MNTPPTLELSREEVVEMDDFELCDHLWSIVTDAYHEQEGTGDATDEEHACDYPESLFAAQLPAHWWTAYGVHAFEYDFLAGGLRQFLDNHEGVSGEQMSLAFRSIGCHDLAEAFLSVANSYQAFRRERCPDYADLDEAAYEKADSELHVLLRERGKDFRRIHEGIDLRERLAQYIRENYALYAR